MISDTKTLSKRKFAALILGVSVLIAVSLRYFCGQIVFWDTDMCWLLDASVTELERAFPNWFRWVYFIVWLAKSGMMILAGTLLIWAYTSQRLKQNLVLSISSMTITVVLSEVALRIVGFSPGQFQYSQWVKPVDSLYQLEGFTTDSIGILKTDVRVCRDLSADNAEKRSLKSVEQFDEKYSGEILGLLDDHWGALPEYSEPWKNWFFELNTDDSFLKKTLLRYKDQPINEMGYYSIPFDAKSAVAPRILLLGDSFTWGHSSSHKSFSFANQLLKEGYWVYNTGISGADVQQYELVLKSVYDTLKPDIVLLNFFMGNDISYFKRPVGLEYPVMYHTNAGSIMTMQNGVEVFEMNEAYSNVMANMEIPKSNVFNKLMASTVMSTYLWLQLSKEGLIEHQFFTGNLFPEESITDSLMWPIVFFCDSVHVPLIISVIPDLKDGELRGVDSEEGLFRGIRCSEPEMTLDMYNQTDGHFNDSGHAFYANYLMNLIDSCVQKTPNNE